MTKVTWLEVLICTVSTIAVIGAIVVAVWMFRAQRRVDALHSKADKILRQYGL